MPPLVRGSTAEATDCRVICESLLSLKTAPWHSELEKASCRLATNVFTCDIVLCVCIHMYTHIYTLYTCMHADRQTDMTDMTDITDITDITYITYITLHTFHTVT